MIPKPGTREMSSPASTEASTPGVEAKPTISFADFSKLWRREVPLVVKTHEEYRLEVRRSLGLA